MDNRFALYDDKRHCYSAHMAEKEGIMLIDNFLAAMENWQRKYRRYGANDTASRDAFAVEVARRLGIDCRK